MITSLVSLSSSITIQKKKNFFLVMKTSKIYSLSKFQIHSAALVKPHFPKPASAWALSSGSGSAEASFWGWLARDTRRDWLLAQPPSLSGHLPCWATFRNCHSQRLSGLTSFTGKFFGLLCVYLHRLPPPPHPQHTHKHTLMKHNHKTYTYLYRFLPFFLVYTYSFLDYFMYYI